jgi:arylsulfatase
MTLKFGPSGVDTGFETRSSLIPLIPSRVTYTVRVPSASVLRFAVGVSTLGGTFPAPVVFRVFIDGGNGDELSFEKVVPREEHNRWFAQEIDLSERSGQIIRLSFDSQLGRELPNADRRILPLWGHPVLTSPSTRGRQPNLVLISVDCLRADHMGAYGYGRDTTPRIDELAADGVVFESGSATSSWTLPSHVSMLTGLLPSSHGVVDRWKKIGGSLRFLPAMLDEAGYAVNGVASWIFVSHIYGFDRGYDVYRSLDESDGGEVIDVALELTRRAEGRSQFLFLHLFDPHWPYIPPDEFLEKFGPRPKDISDLLDKVILGHPPENALEIEQVINLYDAEVAYVDREVGRLFDELKARGIYEESLIILTGDHGEAFFEHDHWAHNVTLHQEVVHVPLIVKWPGNSPKGRAKSPSSIVDIFPTLLEGAGVEFMGLETVNLRTLLGEERETSLERTIVSEVSWAPMGRQGEWPQVIKMSLRDGDLKYFATLEKPDSASEIPSKILEEHLYNLDDDPGELNDLLAEESSAVALEGFRRRLSDYLALADGLRAGQNDEPVELDEATRETLRSLGYIKD